MHLEFGIGRIDDEACDNFSVRILTGENKERIKKYTGKQKIIYLHEFVGIELEKKIQDIINQCEDTNWQKTAKKLAKHFDWEYDNFIHVL